MVHEIKSGDNSVQVRSMVHEIKSGDNSVQV